MDAKIDGGEGRVWRQENQFAGLMAQWAGGGTFLNLVVAERILARRRQRAENWLQSPALLVYTKLVEVRGSNTRVGHDFFFFLIPS